MRQQSLSLTLGIALIGLSLLATVSAIPPPSNLPIQVSQYGVVAVYANESTGLDTMSINVASNGYGAFFVSKLLIFLTEPQQSDLLLSTISVDAYAVTLSSQSYGPQAPKVVVVASGNTMGMLWRRCPATFLLCW